MQFRTVYPKTNSYPQITHQQSLFSVGSCFSENIGNMLYNSGFNITINPYGILFNPVSISKTITEITQQKQYKLANLVEHNGIFNSLNHHSSFSGTDPNTVINTINNTIKQAHIAWQNTQVVFITFGSAWAYKYQNNTVANCHKLPAKWFDKYCITEAEIVSNFSEILTQNSNKHFVFTVSPVRHLKDGFRENTISKATLHLAINQLTKMFNNALYFPAYELVLDDLRNYRFYNSDLLHPNNEAINYIWQYFSTHFFNSNTQALITAINQIKQAQNHRPRFPNSAEHQQFLAKLNKKKQALIKANTFLTEDLFKR